MYVCNYVCMITIINRHVRFCNSPNQRGALALQRHASQQAKKKCTAMPLTDKANNQSCTPSFVHLLFFSIPSWQTPSFVHLLFFSIPSWQWHWILFPEHSPEFLWATCLGCPWAMHLWMRASWGDLASGKKWNHDQGCEPFPALLALQLDMDGLDIWQLLALLALLALRAWSSYLTTFFSMCW